ncbi:carbohydrate-binding protein [Peptoniphilus asaccharolyticus]
MREEIQKFLSDLKDVVKEIKTATKEAKEVKEALESLTDNAKESLKENVEALKKRIDSNMKLTQDSVDLEKITNEELSKIVYVFEPYAQEKKYKKGDCVEQHGKLYRCKKNHTSDYQNMPNLDTDTWEEVKGTGEVVEKKKTREDYQHDKTYRLNDEVVYYRKPYVYINQKAEAGKDPERDTDYWKEIVE